MFLLRGCQFTDGAVRDLGGRDLLPCSLERMGLGNNCRQTSFSITAAKISRDPSIRSSYCVFLATNDCALSSPLRCILKSILSVATLPVYFKSIPPPNSK